MERLSDKLLNILNEQDFCFTPEEMKMVKKAISRFTAYEKTGLGPEEVTELMAAHGTAILELSEYRQFGPKKHLQELAQAEKDGRLVVLPVNPCLKPTQQNEMYICENGKVWAIYVTGCEAGPNSDGVFTVEYMTLDGDVFSADAIGKTVFLTREEAEAALKRGRQTMRLIDADALIEQMRTRCCGYFGEIVDCIMRAPTITPPPNDPLTLEELREMEGEPVWVELIGQNLPSGWYLLNLRDNEAVSAYGGFVGLGHYGQTWTAYRRKPEEGA